MMKCVVTMAIKTVPTGIDIVPPIAYWIVKAIDERQKSNREIWLVDKEKHLANLTRIQQEARAKGQYGVAGKMEELKGKVQGFYIDRNMTLTKEVTPDELNQKMKLLGKPLKE